MDTNLALKHFKLRTLNSNLVSMLKIIMTKIILIPQLNDVGSILGKMMERQLLTENNVSYLEDYLKISYQSLSKRLIPFKQFSDSVTKPLPAPTSVQGLLYDTYSTLISEPRPYKIFPA